MAERSSGEDLDTWLAPFLPATGRKTRRAWAPLFWKELARSADQLVGGSEACLVIDDTALPKSTRSVGVVRQYCGHLGEKANCQSQVSLTLARGEVPVPVALRLLLPEKWVTDLKRRVRACLKRLGGAEQG